MAHISVVIPVYNAEECLHELYRRLKLSLEQITNDFEIILVEDCGRDRSWEVISELVKNDFRVKGIKLSRNFGQHFAITAGLEHSDGDWVVVLDCDLQDQPEEIQKLYEKALEGFEIVFGRRVERQDNWLKKLGSRVFYKIFDYFTDSKSDSSIASFSICSRNVINNFIKFREHNRIYHVFLQWMGFSTAYVNIKHSKRYAGKSGYSFSKMVNLAVNNIVVMSNKPLRLFINLGFLISFSALIYGLHLIIQYVWFFQPIAGWTSVMVSLYFLGGLTFANLGILGLYIGKVFDETKNRPLYIIKEKMGFEVSEKVIKSN